MILWIICNILGLLAGIISNDLNKIAAFTAILSMIILFITLLLWRHLPSGMVDAFYIRNEIPYVITIFCCIALVVAILGILQLRDTILGWQMVTIMSNITMAILACMTVLYPIYKMKKDSKFGNITPNQSIKSASIFEARIMNSSNLDLKIIASKPSQYDTWLKYMQ